MTRSKVLVVCLTLAAIGIGVVLVEVFALVRRDSESDIRAAIVTAVPIGSSEQDLLNYFDGEALSYFNADSVPERSGAETPLPAGSRIIGSFYDQGGSLFLVPAREIRIYAVLNAGQTVDRIVVYERTEEPCFACSLGLY